jgi:hypothetical protein
MILGFSTQINNKPTYFVQKIHKCFSDILQTNVDSKIHYTKDYSIEKRYGSSPKLHTIRKDKNDRWKAGTMIDFYINARTKDMYCFAPRILVQSIQSIVISNSSNGFQVSVDGKNLWNYQIKELAINDGFEGIEDFQEYFISRLENCFFIGKLIHWTNLRY